ncbi:TM2 domain-containing protein [Lactiplantibacillus pentosus]|uniref:TM2 domain-containing protein n=1 Tax=Lactiplantibacillus pentosus TaxID=1589 RepID=A0ABD7IKP9_LACPE|nr:TM2 domain-containing protein [Lactiplantibacillus pentosus]RMW42831.1 TM2 domain-containing protein [Lactiplantibacillus pentosus]
MINNANLRGQLTNEEVLVLNSEIELRKKPALITYLLCLFIGTLGAHRYYVGKTGSAIAMTLITVLTLGFGAIVTGIWALVDLFLINGWLQDDRSQIEANTIQTILNKR